MRMWWLPAWWCCALTHVPTKRAAAYGKLLANPTAEESFTRIQGGKLWQSALTAYISHPNLHDF